MGEADKIRKFIERHKDVLEVCGVDVAESSINGEWFVYYYNTLHILLLILICTLKSTKN